MLTGERSDQNPIDALVADFVSAPTEEESARLLDLLIDNHVLPLVRRIIQSRLRSSSVAQDCDDITNEVAVHLVTRLRECRSNLNGRLPRDFQGYVAVATYNACHDYLRKKYPERSRLKSRLRYVLTHDARFGVWEGKQRDWLCGLEEWRESKTPSPEGRLRQISDNLRQEMVSASCDATRGHDLARLAGHLFDHVGGPVRLDDLVDMIGSLLNVRDQAHEARTTTDRDIADDRHVRMAAGVEHRLYLERLWIEIRELPVDQRRALLLNLRDEDGRDITTLITLARIASVRQIAEALAIQPEEFARLFHELPLDDLSIAEMLGTNRQRVINLRKAARLRLVRRMDRLNRGNPASSGSAWP